MAENLEHEGDEFFEDLHVTNRKDVEIFEQRQEEEMKKLANAAKDKLQNEWLHIDNPALWDGEID